jgi:ATP-dependent DNA helicase DinG
MSSPAQSAPPRPCTEGSLYSFFGPGGVLAKAHPQYEFRRGQLQMAEAVEQALREGRHLVVEAGTGTGKTLAYLLPAIRSGKRVVISTGTKNLQEQLFYKDIPFLQQVVFPAGEGELRACYMKGRNNYLCRQKLYDLSSQPVLSGLEEIEQYRSIAEWEKTTETGDRAELSGLAETAQLWSRLDARSEACTGQKCPQYDRCFITEMHRRAAESDIIVVNHHLFFADLAIKQMAEGAPDAGILPDYAAVIFDEAHELEEVAGQYFGITVGDLRMEELCRDVEQTLRQKQIAAPGVLSASASVRQRSQLFFAVIPAGEGRAAFDTRREFLEENGDEFVALMQALSRLHSELEGIAKQADEIFNLIRRAEELRMQLGFIMETEDRNTVIWIEKRRFGTPGTRDNQRSGRQRLGPQHVFLQATPIDVSGILRETVFQQIPATVLTSATLAVSSNFQYIGKRLGLEQARELIVPSHFDYASQALLYVPPDLPDPRTEQFAACAAARIRQLLDASRGRAFCLFTSYALMHEVHDRLLGELEFPLLLQGTAPRTALLEEFRNTPHAVLFATSSFWQGVDVQGQQLSCVIIDRLPFAVPNDPVVAARIHAIDAEGGNAFFDFQVPAAVISLKQGFGRLIRSLHDRGVLALLDNRILRKQYGCIFLQSLPPYARTLQLEDVQRFFGAEAAQL